MSMNGENGLPKPGNFDDDMKVLDDLEPEVVDGPFGLPVVKPKGAPEFPLGGGEQ